MTKNIYKRTTISCFVGIFTQAIMTNFVAILFVPMMKLYGFSYAELGILVAVNFLAQVSADISFSGVIDKVGYKKIVLPTTICSFVGLCLLGLSPFIFSSNMFLGVMLSTIVFAFSSGLLEIILSPIISAMPGDAKGPAMSLMHSFYAWGQVLTIIVTTLFIFIFGNESWQIICFVWALVPVINFFMFLGSKFPDIIPETTRQNLKDLIFKPFYIFAMLAICFGACTEIVMNQWASAFMENGLGFDKVTGDLIGLCGFAVFMGLGRTIYGIFGAKINLHKILVVMSLLSAVCYVTSAVSTIPFINIIACIFCGFTASLLWPGTIVVTADRYPLAGAWMFAILAAAGDIGASFGPFMTGLVVDITSKSEISNTVSMLLGTNTEQSAIRIGLLAAAIFPIWASVCFYAMNKMKTKK